YIGNKTTALEYAGKKITPILNPMGINDDNWPATVGLITGTLAIISLLSLENLYYKPLKTDYEICSSWQSKLR
ncbi:nucleoside recognition domain-containing protein, partial [Francisella tularensis]|uniref:nucleoside recognition domain-containing protein n=1 Tax=Francisella tularensis TaxID=263 RepID=UPI0022777BBB